MVEGIVLDIATTRRLTITLTLTVLLEMAENGGPQNGSHSEWRADTKLSAVRIHEVANLSLFALTFSFQK